jgi:hypothetical protein
MDGDTSIRLRVKRFRQPDNYTCGPACLAAVYDYHGQPRPLAAIIRDTPRNPDGGTVGVFLGLAAQAEGFAATIYSYNMHVFDPTWHRLPPEALIRKLERQAAAKREVKLRRVLRAYVRFLRQGGRVRFADLRTDLLVRHLAAGQPVITGLSATWLYRSRREFADRYNDIRGEPVGHFVVISGWDPVRRRFEVRDPSRQVPFATSGRYAVEAARLMAAILLGERTYDGVLLVLEPPA